jgi:hypothetical protein
MSLRASRLAYQVLAQTLKAAARKASGEPTDSGIRKGVRCSRGLDGELFMWID